MKSLQYRASDYTSSIWDVSSVERAGSPCYTCSVSSIEEATVQEAMRAYTAWSETAVVVIAGASPV